MTNVSVIFANDNASAIADARINDAIKNEATASNVKRLTSSFSMLQREKIISLLTKSHVNVETFDDMYRVNMLADFLSEMLSHDEQSAKFQKENNLYHAYRTMLNLRNADMKLTRNDIADALLVDCTVAEERKSYIYARSNRISATRQVQLAIKSLVHMNVIVADDKKESVFSFKTNALSKAIEKVIAKHVASVTDTQVTA